MATSLAAFATTGVSATNLLLNGGFESSAAPDAFLPAGSTAITAWTIGGPSVHFATPHPQWPGNNTQFVDLTGNQGSGYIEQSFDTIVGKSYTVSLRIFNGSAIYSTGGIRTTALALTVTGSATHTFDVPASTEATIKYEFQATAARTTLRLADATGIDSNASWIDDVAVVEKIPVVFASGLSPVIAYDPIYPATAYPWEMTPSQPIPVVGYDAAWVNPHPATIFPIGSHPWEFIQPYDFTANWINAWSDMNSRGPRGQSWTKYTTTVAGEGDFVLQFLADNASWIYIDGKLVGFQDWDWPHNGTGRYTIHLTGSGNHELCFIIWDGGGLAGGKFRLETTDSFIANNPGDSLPPPPPATDKTAPVISAPGTIETEATSAAGAVVNFSATATDDKDGNVPVAASPASGSTFPLGTTGVGLAASDAAGNTATASFDVIVKDTTAPVITAPANITAEATSSAGASVSYSASAYDIVDNSTAVAGSPASGSTFPLGNTTVTLTSSDSRHNSASATFQVTVQDTTAPTIKAPTDIVAEATSAAGATVAYSASATDIVDGNTTVVGSPASESTFALGSTSVALKSADAHGNTSTSSFNVTVRDTTAPTLSVPANQVLEATSAAGAVATFSASASDAVGVTSLTSSAASGSTFPIGTTTVTVTAKDAAGNSTSGSFSITVQDTIAPTLNVPANQVLEATSAAGATAMFSASASDAVGVASLTTSAPSGSTFPIGTTTVTVTAKDAAGNATRGSFTITVRDTTTPVISSLTPSSATLWPPNHQMVAITLSAPSSDAVGITSLRIVNVTSSEPDNGLGDGDTAGDIQVTGNLTLNLRAERAGKGNGRIYTITVEARDAAGNASTRTTTVSVPKSMGK
jgi:hypothetical protein